MKRFDLVVLQRKLFNWVNFLPLRLAARKLVYDLDDALFYKDSKSDRRESATRSVRFRRTALRSDFVICGNEWILKKTKEITPHAGIIPTVVDTSLYGEGKRDEEGSGFRAVWIGGRSTLFYLEEILPALEPLKDRIPGFRLRVISDVFPENRAIPIEKVPWSRATEIRAIQGADVGLMPLVPDAWSEGKCGLKLLQYGAAGLPMVSSPVGVNKEINEDGVSGFQAENPSQWQEALCTLAQDKELRRRMGREARRRVCENFSLQRFQPEVMDLLRKVAGKA